MIMKKIFLAMLLAVSSLSAFAQFEKGTKYVGATLDGMGLDLSFQKHTLNFGLNANAGYFFEDAWMGYAQFGYNLHNIKGDGNDTNTIAIGAGARYYIRQNGLFLGLGLKYKHNYNCGFNSNDFCLTPEVGYCFYLNHYVSIEPSVYYDISLNRFSEGSKVGLRVGVGYYF